MAKVYVINDMNHNFDKAKRFGELSYVTKGKVPIFKTDVAKTMLEDGLKEFDTKEDYLLVSGAPVLCMMAALIVVSASPVKMLIFDAKEQDYVVRHLAI